MAKYEVVNIIGEEEIPSQNFEEWCRQNANGNFIKNATKTISDCKLLEKIA